MVKNQKKTLRAAIYIRVSTEDQRKGYGLQFQLEDCKRTLVRDRCMLDEKRHVIDDSKTGSTDARPGWDKLMEMARQKEFDVVYFWKLDRMMRNEYYYFVNEKEFNDLGIELRFATENLEDPLMRSIRVAIAADERRKIVERSTRGKEMALRSGKWVVGMPAYGYKIDPKTQKLVVVRHQAKWVRKFFEWLVYEQCSLREIARRANSFKIPTKLQEIRSQKSTSGLWQPRTLGRMLTNEVYTGRIYMRKYKRTAPHKGLKTYENIRNLREQHEWIPFDVPTIVPKDLFEAAIRQLRRNSDFAKRKKKREYLFSGLLICSGCSVRLRGQYSRPTSKTAQGSRNYFNLQTRFQEVMSIKTKQCKYCGCIAESRLMPIWHALVSILTNPVLAYSKIQKFTASSRNDSVTERVVYIEKQLISLEKERTRANKAFLDMGVISEEEYEKRMTKISQEQKRLQAEQHKLKNVLITEQERTDRVNTISNLYIDLRNKLQNPTYEMMVRTLRIFVDRIILNIEMNTARVEFAFPGSPDILQDNHGSSCPAKNFAFIINVPLITSQEAVSEGNPERRRYFERRGMTSPYQQLAVEKAGQMEPVGVLVAK